MSVGPEQPTWKLEPIDMPAGTLVHINGHPFYLEGDTFVLGRWSNVSTGPKPMPRLRLWQRWKWRLEMALLGRKPVVLVPHFGQEKARG